MAQVRKSAKKTTKTNKAAKATTTNKVVKTTPVKKPSAKKADGKMHKGLFIGIIIAAVVAVAAAVICFFCFGRANVVGSYELTGIERNGEDQSSSLDILEGLGMTASLELKDDKTGELDLFGEKTPLTFDGNQITMNGVSTEFTYKDGQLSLENNGAKLTFTKINQ